MKSVITKTTFIILMVSSSTLLFSAQHLYTKFKDPVKVSKFQQVTDQLVCQCGCQMPLSSCNHVTCFAWTMRNVIEHYIDAGKSPQQIVMWFKDGFKSEVDTNTVLFDSVEKGIKEEFRKGWGNKIINKPNVLELFIIIAIMALTLIGIIIYFIMKKKKVLAQADTSLSDKEQELLDSLADDED